MHRQPLLDQLALYRARHPEEEQVVDSIVDLVSAHRDCFQRSCLPGHVTGSSWIVDAALERGLLTHHRKLARWLQLGGHADGDPDVPAVALREAREESGMQDFDVIVPEDGCSILDVDVHVIPAFGNEPAHEHHDIRFLFRAAPGQGLTISSESNDLAWFAWADLGDVGADESVLRLGRKARAVFANERFTAVRNAQSTE